MAEHFELELPFTSPFRQTQLFIEHGRAFFGIWRPFDVRMDGDEREVFVQQGEDGQLDMLADRYYNDRTLWPVIAQANQIDRVFEQVPPGTKLKIPKLGNVRAALLALSKTQETV